VDFYHRKEIKDVLAYLRIIVNPDDELSLERIINVPARGISDAAVQRMQAQALANGWNLWQTLGSIDKIPGATARTVNAVRHFLELVRRWQGLAIGAVSTQQAAASTDGQAAGAAGQGRIRALMEEVVRTSGLEGYLKKIGGEELEELANVNELISHAAQFDEENPQATVEDYLAQISLVSDVDTLQETGGAVTLMTLHAAKGLEFPIVAIIGMEEEILPHARVRDHPEQLEEERRLCFVGITRAQELLVLSRAARRTMRGERLPTIGSRFLEEMPADGLEIVDVSGEGFEHESEGEPESSGVGGEFRKGQMVRHAAFGVGRILEISETGQLTRAVVDFTKAGRKTLILEYARLQPGG
jgi:DNA helicase-2/ATP-dependent DNA helicase PcrA